MLFWIQDWYYLLHHNRHHLSHNRNSYIAHSSISLQISEAIKLGQLTTSPSLSTLADLYEILTNKYPNVKQLS